MFSGSRVFAHFLVIESKRGSGGGDPNGWPSTSHQENIPWRGKNILREGANERLGEKNILNIIK